MEKLSKLLELDAVKLLKGSKNLLAFSAGTDSTALFFLLLEQEVEFDIAIVNYAKRESAKKELEYANFLAKTHHKKCFNITIILEDANFEKKQERSDISFLKKLSIDLDIKISLPHIN